MSEKLLEIQDLYVRYRNSEGTVHAVNGIRLELGHAEVLGLVGETGAGKTSIALSILQLLQEGIGKVEHGSIIYKGQNLLELNESEMNEIRGEEISMIFQDPMTSLNPVLSIEEQIGEAIELHHKLDDHEISLRVDEMLEMVGIAKERKIEYPHQFSGGMKQRVIIAIALSCNPKLLIADEPTTALDVTVQAQVLELMNHLRERLGTSLLLITHDLGVIAQMCDRVAVLYAGEIVEMGTLNDLFDNFSFKHPYTEGLFGALPNLHSTERRLHPVEGLMPDPMELPSGCAFHPRCKSCMEICERVKPTYAKRGEHFVLCHLYESKK